MACGGGTVGNGGRVSVGCGFMPTGVRSTVGNGSSVGVGVDARVGGDSAVRTGDAITAIDGGDGDDALHALSIKLNIKATKAIPVRDKCST
jgi:hypothetical protein